MRKVSAKRKVRKTRKEVEYAGSGSDNNVDVEADENGGKNESSDNESDKSKTVKRKSRKNGKDKVEDEEEEKAEKDETEKPENNKSEDDDEEEEEPEEEYEVQEIVDHKVEKGETFYLIRWKGYGPDGDTWEPEDTLNCPDIVSKFLKKVKGKKAVPATKGKKGAGAPKRGRPIKRKAEESKDQEPVDPDKEWEVERIINYGYEKGVRIFQIRWRGYSAKFDTWEPEEHLNCHDMIEKFLKRVEKPNVERKELRETPKQTERFGGDSFRRGSKRYAGRSRTVYYGEDD